MKRYIKSAVNPISEEDYDVKMEIAKNPNTSTDTLIELADVGSNKETNLILLRRVCEHPNMTLDALLTIREKHPSFVVDEYLAIRTADPDLLDELADTDNDFFLLNLIVKNPNTSIDTLLKLYRTYRNVISRITVELSKRRDISAEVIDDLIEDSTVDSYDDVSRAVLMNLIFAPNLTQEQLTRIANFAIETSRIDPDGCYDLCTLLAKSKRTPTDVRRRLFTTHSDVGTEYYAGPWEDGK